MKILVVDDDELIVKSSEMYLSTRGYQVFTAMDGVEALEVIKSQNPNIIISDIMMPNMNGLELLDVIKNELKLATPVILMSSLDDASIIEDALNNGAEDFMIKPVKLADLVIRIKKAEIQNGMSNG